MGLNKFALTNYYSYNKDKNNKHICPECNREIKGWARTQCSTCNRFFCRRHMEPSVGSFKECPQCRQRKNMFRGSSDALIEAFRIANTSEDTENRLFASLFAGKELYKFAQETDTEENPTQNQNEASLIEMPPVPVSEIPEPETQYPEKPQQEMPEAPPVQTPAPEAPQEGQETVVDQLPIPTTTELVDIEPIIESLSNQITDILESTGINYSNITPEILDNILSTAVRTARLSLPSKTAYIVNVEEQLMKDPDFQAPGFERTIRLDPGIANEVDRLGNLIRLMQQVDLSAFNQYQRNYYFNALAQLQSAHNNLIQNPSSPTNIINIWNELKSLAASGQVDPSMLESFKSAYGRYITLP